MADASDGRVTVALRILRQELVGRDAAVRAARHDVSKRPAAVDPELPARRRAGHLRRRYLQRCR